MTNNQTFPILNVITENLRLSHGHVSVVPLHRGKDVERNLSDSVNLLRSIKSTGVINTRGTSFGVERNCGKFVRTCETSDLRQTHYCTKHRNSLQEDSSGTLATKNSASEVSDNFVALNGSTRKFCTSYERNSHAACAKTQYQSFDASVKGKFCDQQANLTEGFVPKDIVGVNHCRCGHTTQQILCGAVGLRIGNLPSGVSNVRNNFPVNGEAILQLQTGTVLSRAPDVYEGQTAVGQNLWYKKHMIQSSDALPLSSKFPVNSSSATAWNPDPPLRHVTEKLQSTIVWWRQPLEGQLFKYTNVMKGWQYRWFVLNPDLGKLEYFEKEDHKKCYRPRGFLRLVGAVVCPSDEDSQTFMVNAANGESYRLKAFDARERQHWVNRLRATAEFHTESLLNSSALCKNDHVTVQSTSLNSAQSTNRPAESVSQARHSRTLMRDSPKSSIPKDHVPESVESVTSSLKECTDQLSTVRSNHESVMNAVDSLPLSSSSGNVIGYLDKDVLLLKATSSATALCLKKCLSLLQNQASDSRHEKSAGLRNPAHVNSSNLPPTYSSLQLHDTADLPVSSDNSPLHFCYNGQLQENTALSIANDEVRVNHEDEIEDPEPYSDVELSGMEEHKSVILHLLSQLKLGMDLTKVVLPTFILEKRSLLEMFADCMAHPDLFLRIPDMPTPESRILAVVEWFLTSFHAGRQGSVAKKPYNPIIGESFHCSWLVNTSGEGGQHNGERGTSAASNRTSVPGQSSSATNIPSNNSSHQSCLYYCAEQVSHHPPVSAFYYENPEKQMYMDASIWTRSKFMGMSIGVTMVGKVHLHLLSYGEEYEFSLPSAYARSILTVPWVELGDKIMLNCEKTGYSASVIFHTKPFYGGRLHKVTAEVRNPSSEPICKISGEWNGQMEFTYANGSSKIVDTSQLPVARKRVRPLKMQGSMESRKLWRNVTESLRKGDVAKATEDKQQLEEIQRQNEKRRRESRMPFPTKYFCRVGDEWMFKKRLRVGQNVPSI